MRNNGVRYLLMGGQACVFYGAAEFSRDVDILVLLDDANLDCLRNALAELEASQIAIPPLSSDALVPRHAVHFQCQRPDIVGLRIDVMSRLRGVDSFQQLWERRTTIQLEGEPVDILSLPDLVLAKKDSARQGLADDSLAHWSKLSSHRLTNRLNRSSSCLPNYALPNF